MPCPFCSSLLWPNERPNGATNNKNIWPCCQSGENDLSIPDAPKDWAVNPEPSPRDDAVKQFDQLIYDTIERDGRVELTDLCKAVRKQLSGYNNAVSFASEGVTGKVDHHVSHYNFRIQGQLRHMIGPSVPRVGDDPKFAQIYNIDGTQDQLDTRLLHNSDLDRETLKVFQNILRKCNPFAVCLHDCSHRLSEHGDSAAARMVIRQLDPRRAQRGTHNRPTNEEVATVVVGLDDVACRESIDRDIIVEMQGGALQRITYWHSCYMPLRYPLIFPYGEQSWQNSIAMASHIELPSHHLLAARSYHRAGHVYNHNLALNPDRPLAGDDNDLDDVVAAPDENANGGARYGRGGSKRITLRSWYRKSLQRRPDRYNRIHRAGPVQLRYLTDAWACCEMNDLNFLRRNQQALRVSKYSAFEDRIATDENVTVGDIGKEHIVLPSTHIGSPRYLKQKMQDCLALVRRYGKPEFFITFTCNPSWPEIKECQEPGLGSETVVDLEVRVFKLKLDELLRDLFKAHVLGRTVATAYVIEFQKRGLPHAHILIIVAPEDRITTPEAVNQCIRADLPSEAEDPELRSIVLKNMIHGRCDRNINAPCMDPRTNKCRHGFPKRLTDRTLFNVEDGYPVYRRPDTGPISETDDRDNAWVVAYSPWLLKKYNAHLNVEVCSSVKAVQYLYKYIYKGPSAGNFSIQNDVLPNRAEQESVNEIDQYLDARWIGSAEAVWHLNEFSMGQISPSIERLPVHLPGSNTVVLNPRTHDELADLDKERLAQTKLTEWFALNADADELDRNGIRPLPDPRRWRYDEIPEHYVWNTRQRKWTPRKKQRAVGRMYSLSPRSGELFYLRLLLNNVAGATSYEYLCTVDGVLLQKQDESLDFQAASRLRGLCDDDLELHAALLDGAALGTAADVRQLFVSILIHSCPSDPLKLFEDHCDHLSSDCRHRLAVTPAWAARFLNAPQSQSTVDLLEHRSVEHHLALYFIERLLEKEGSGKTLEDFNLPPVLLDFGSAIGDSNPLIRDEESYVIDPQNIERDWASFNPDQRRAAESIMDAIDSTRPDNHLFFLNGPGGTGKTFIQNTVLAKVRHRQLIALAVASSGIAATLLQGGTTAHSKFKIPLDADEVSRCNIPKGSNLAALMQKVRLIFWDEAPMQSRFDMQAVSNCLIDLCCSDDPAPLPFAGKVVVFCGDFRQTLPVVPNGSEARIIAKSLRNSPFWPQIKILHLTENMRLQQPGLSPDDKQRVSTFANELLGIGQGKGLFKDSMGRTLSRWDHGWLPPASRGQLIDRVYPGIRDLHHQTSAEQSRYLSERAILAVANADVTAINDAVVSRMEGQCYTFWSTNKAKSVEDEGNYQPEYFSAISTPSMAPHQLQLKVGMTVMCIRNMMPPAVCNGTRLRVTQIMQRAIKCEILTGAAKGQTYLAHRILQESKDNDRRIPCAFVRKQFPLRHAFAMTVNKSQGQSLKHVGIDLACRPVFGHGQLYVGLSRTTDFTNLHVLGSHLESDHAARQLVNVVWPQVLLPPPSSEDGTPDREEMNHESRGHN